MSPLVSASFSSYDFLCLHHVMFCLCCELFRSPDARTCCFFPSLPFPAFRGFFRSPSPSMEWRFSLERVTRRILSSFFPLRQHRGRLIPAAGFYTSFFCEPWFSPSLPFLSEIFIERPPFASLFPLFPTKFVFSLRCLSELKLRDPLSGRPCRFPSACSFICASTSNLFRSLLGLF